MTDRKPNPLLQIVKTKLLVQQFHFNFRRVSGLIVFNITAMAFSMVILRSTTVTVKFLGVTFSESPR